MRKELLFIISTLLLILSAIPASAQRLAVSTNAVEWADLVTFNAEAGLAVGQHFSVHAGVKVNPWVYRASKPEARFDDPNGDYERQFQRKKQSYDVSIRWWPWYVYSGWWVDGGVQYMEYDFGGVSNRAREAGDAYGVSLAAGYTYMLNRNWNLDFGAGLWGGYKTYGTYRCTNCGRPVEKGEKPFILPNYLTLAVMYVF